MPDAHARRRAALAELLADRGADAALITRLVNVRYLTGLDSSNAALLLTADGTAVLATDGRYATAARALCPDVELQVERQVGPPLVERATQDAGGAPLRLGIEEHDVTLEAYDALRDAAGRTDLVRLRKPVEQLRTRKDDTELDALRRACAISCRALEDLLVGPLLGRTEKDVAVELERRMVDLGAEGIAFETIVATGPDSAVPHHRAGDRLIARGDLLKIDFGARVDGYHADCTRTVVAGSEPAAWQREVYELVATAQRAGVDALSPGADCIEVDRTARDVIAAGGHGDAFTHGLGHGVGLEVHEAPVLGKTVPGTLADRVPVTVEPGVYLPGRGGVRIEDTLVVREAGTQLLTTTTKELLVVGA